MIESTTTANGFMKLTATAGLIHKKGTEEYKPTFLMLPGETHDLYEEVAEKPAATKQQYCAEVERLVALRYTCGQEIQLLAEKDSDPQAYRNYRAYVEQCKQTAQQTLNNAQTI